MGVEKTFKTKKDWWIGLILFGGFATLLFATTKAILEPDVVGMIITFPCVAFYAWLLYKSWIKISYRIENGQLKTSGMMNFSINIGEISTIRNAKGMERYMSTAATSTDRLTLLNKDNNALGYVSPADKMAFAKALQEVNADIDISGVSE